MSPEPGFRLDALGEWTAARRFEVDRDRVAAYAAATNDPLEEHRSGKLAPPVFAVVPAFETSAEAVLAVAPVELLMMLVHGEQDFAYHRPIEAGMDLVTRSAPVGVRQTSAGVVVAVRSQTRTAEGDLVTDQWMSTFFRGAQGQEPGGVVGPEHALEPALRAAPPFAEVSQHVDEDQPVRYAEPSGDHNPIHLDADFARAVGLPGIINHGLCTMAFASHAVLGATGSDPRALRRLAVRFARPVLPGQDIATRCWRNGDGSVAFETASGGGMAGAAGAAGAAETVVIKDGLAVFGA